MNHEILTPEQEAYLRAETAPAELNHEAQRAEKLGVLAIDTTNTAVLKEALDCLEALQPWVDEQITKLKAKQSENGR